MPNHQSTQFAGTLTTCGSMLCELQKIWDEVGEPDVERDETIMEIERECLAVYGRKMDEAKTSRAQLQRAIALSESEIADICSSLGEQLVICDRRAGGKLKEKLKIIVPQLEDVRKRKIERKNQFVEVLNQLQEISDQIFTEDNRYKIIIDETDLSVRRLEELHKQLVDLQIEKKNRSEKVVEYLSKLNPLCLVLGVDFKDTICKIHPSLDDSNTTKDVTNNTIEKLTLTIRSLQEVKIQRMQKLQYLATSLLELWNFMDTPVEEQRMFRIVTKKIAASEHEISEPNMLSINNIKYVEGEVSRLEQLKARKMKELVLKKRLELEEICKKMHTTTEELGDYSIKAIESGSVDPLYLLEELELQIDNVKEEAFSRKEILEKVDKLFAAREEECWLEEYNRDDNRYNAGRGSHLILKRAEKARALVNKIPAMVESLTSKVTAWEKERGVEFLYDGGRLLSMLAEYSDLMQEREKKRQRHRDQKRLQGQLMAEQQALYRSKLSPSKSGKKASRILTGTASNRKLSLGGEMLHNLKYEKASVRVHSNKKLNCSNRSSPLNQQSGGFAVCSGRRNSEIADHIVKKRSSAAVNAREVESKLVRKPLSELSPVSLAISSKANIANFLEDEKITQKETPQKTFRGCKTVVVTPSKSTFVGDEENKTPKTTPMPVPATPSTVTVPMLMAMTPASVSFGTKAVRRIVENVEYSFEEVRAGFVCR